MRRRILLQAGGAIVAAATAVAARAQAWPSRPIRLVVPFPAGGGTDAMARALGDAMARDTGQPVLVDNRAGAGTVIGNDLVAKSAPDGHTLLLNTSALAIVPSLYPRLPYPADTAFAAVMLLGRAPNVAVVRAESPLASAADFLAKARARPGGLAYGSAGNGTSTHLAAELLKNSAGIFVTHVPYRGATPMVNDVLAGQIDLGFGTLPSVAPFLATGKLRALAVSAGRRSPLLPAVPTFAEAGVAGYEADVWYGLFAPAGLPDAVLQAVHAAMRRSSATPAFERRAAQEGLQLTREDPATTERIVREERAKWLRLVQAQSIKAE